MLLIIKIINIALIWGFYLSKNVILNVTIFEHFMSNK